MLHIQDTRLLHHAKDGPKAKLVKTLSLHDYIARRFNIALRRERGSESNRDASCSVIAPANCSTSVIVTARS